ncbi:MAG: WbqC family protein [Solobacterium sp.]|nr:WbqC family protein [Solobacterium sp.]
MKVAINQPYFIPYIAYWQLIDSVDTFAIADNYNYIKQGWINRNRILEGNTVRYFNIKVDHASQNRLILDHRIKPIDKETALRQLKGFYHTAPYCREGLELMDRMLSFEGDNLADFLYQSICLVCDYLQIRTRIIRTSDFEQDPGLRFTDRIYDYCRQMGADTYHNLIGGTKLYSFEEFEAQGLKLAFIETIPVPYHQSSDSFEFGLSILDIIMQNSVEDIRQMLKSYRLITE